LPVGPLFFGFLLRGGQALLGSFTDRRDFYHQAAVTSERSKSNMIPFSISRSELRGLSALERFEVEEACRRKRPREERGHHLECDGKFSREAADSFFPWFTAPFQGDHLGVEYGLEGHQNLLRS